MSKVLAQFTSEENARLAVLIDADNAQPAIFEAILSEIASFGEATVKRIYGDFTSSQSASWKKILQQHAIKPIQQFAYTTGKNATDSTMIIDAMDLLYTQRFDGFCIISSDSDFTGLAMRIKEQGLMVYGFGEKKTPIAFRNACHKFILTEILKTNEIDENIPTTYTKNEAVKYDISSNEFPMGVFKQALEQSADDSGWSQLGTLGSYLNKLKSDFDSRVYGYKKLSDLVKNKSDLFKTQEKAVEGSDKKNLYVRLKNINP